MGFAVLVNDTSLGRSTSDFATHLTDDLCNSFQPQGLLLSASEHGATSASFVATKATSTLQLAEVDFRSLLVKANLLSESFQV